MEVVIEKNYNYKYIYIYLYIKDSAAQEVLLISKCLALKKRPQVLIDY